MTRGLVKTIRAGATIIIAVLCLFSVLSDGTASLRVTFLDVGQGDAIFVQTPKGASVLIDGGKDARVLRKLYTQMPYFRRSIDTVIATHPDADHVGGLAEVVKRYQVKSVYYTHMQHDTPQVTLFERALKDGSIEQKELRAGDIIHLDADVYMHVLHPVTISGVEDTNSSSVIIRLVHRDISFLLTGDAPVDIEYELARRYGNQLQSSVLKLGHHGSNTSTSEIFLGYVHPMYAVISRGCDNEYGHPHVEVLDRLIEFNVPFLDTCALGSITFESTGSSLNIIH